MSMCRQAGGGCWWVADNCRCPNVQLGMLCCTKQLRSAETIDSVTSEPDNPLGQRSAQLS
jgi:hypothetical protein